MVGRFGRLVRLVCFWSDKLSISVRNWSNSIMFYVMFSILFSVMFHVMFCTVFYFMFCVMFLSFLCLIVGYVCLFCDQFVRLDSLYNVGFGL